MTENHDDGAAREARASELAAELGLDPAHLMVGRMENLLRAAIQLIDDYLAEGVSTLSGTSEFAIAHLASRSLADLKAGTFLFASGFVVQTFSVIRPVLESLNLIQLFVNDPVRADVWFRGYFARTVQRPQCPRGARPGIRRALLSHVRAFTPSPRGRTVSRMDDDQRGWHSLDWGTAPRAFAGALVRTRSRGVDAESGGDRRSSDGPPRSSRPVSDHGEQRH